MGAACAKCRTATIDAIPERDVMYQIVDRIVEFEEMLKRGESLSPGEERERKKLGRVAKAMCNGSTYSVSNSNLKQ